MATRRRTVTGLHCPLYAPDAADIADSSNPAWTWAPGVKEKVLDTVIARGYVVPGGYS